MTTQYRFRIKFLPPLDTRVTFGKVINLTHRGIRRMFPGAAASKAPFLDY